MAVRSIVQIDEDLCDGCGLCIPECVEGALQIIDGKAKLVSDVYCDGMGMCLGHCPLDAITIIERDAEEFDEDKVENRLSELGATGGNGNETVCAAQARIPATVLPNSQTADAGPRTPGISHGCPGSAERELRPATAAGPAHAVSPQTSHLGNWPVQLHLLNPRAPFFRNADLLLAADCVPFSFPSFHSDFLAGRVVAIGCPKLDDTSPYVEKLAEIFRGGIRSLTVLLMEVPCCGGLFGLAQKALVQAGREFPVRVVVIGIKGDVLHDHGPPKCEPGLMPEVSVETVR